MLLRQSTNRSRLVLMVDSSDHVTGKAGLTLTVTASKDGGAFASISPAVTERGDGWYSLALTTSHTDTLGDLALHVTGSGADPTDVVDQVVVELPGTVAAVNTGAITAGAIAADAIGASELAADAAAEIAAAVRTELATELGRVDATISSRLATSGYTAPPSAATNASAVRTELATELGRIDATVSSRASSSALGTVAADVVSVLGAVDTEVAAIKAKTDSLQFAGGNVLADVRALASAPVAVDTGTAGTVSFISGEYVATTGGTVNANIVQVDGENVVSDGAGSIGTFGGGTAPTAAEIADEVETRELDISQTAADKVWSSAARTLTSFGTLAADAAAAVWAATTRILTAGTNIVLAKGTGVTGFNDLSAAQVNAEADAALADVGVTSTVTGRIDVAVSTRLATSGYTAPPSAATNASAVRTELATELGRVDVAVSTRLAGASYTAPDNSGIAAIKAKTDNLPGDPADASDIAAAFASLSSAVGAVNTLATAIKAKTDNLPSDPADASEVDALISALSAIATAIKAKTDNLPATPAATGDAMTLTTGERGAVADAMLGRNLAGGSDGGRTVQDALRINRNRVKIESGVVTVYAEDDTTPAWTGLGLTAPGNPLVELVPD